MIRPPFLWLLTIGVVGVVSILVVLAGIIILVGIAVLVGVIVIYTHDGASFP